MAKKGVKSITGPSTIKVGEWTDYKVSSWYDATPANESNEAHVKWAVFQENKGKWQKVLEKEQGRFRFQEGGVGNTYIIVAYSHEPELDNASAMKVKVVSAEKREVLRVEMTDINDNKLTKALPYGRKVKAKAYTTGMVGEKILFKMWEDDAEGGGHSEENKYNLVAQAMAKIGEKGLAIVEFTLKPDFKVIAKAHAGKGGEGKTHEYYVTAVATLKSNYVAGSNFNVYSPEEIKKAEEDQLKGNPPKENTPPSAVEKVKVKPDKIEIDVPTNVTKTKVEDSKTDVPKIEALIDAYFAKEEFTKETTEKAGKQQYTFKNENKNIDKDKIAAIIKKKVDADIKKDKKYSKLEDIKAALTKTTYTKNEVISFDVYKLGANFVKIKNAPLEDEIYVVAKTVLLDGKEVNIKIKEKEEILIAKAADLPVQEAKKDGAELTTLKATVEKGEAKIKIKLRPKSDEDLKKWKEKLAGIKDGQHTYTFGGKNDTSTDAKKKSVAGVIIKKIKDELAKNKKFAKSEEIVKVLVNASYDKGEKITFDTYKVPTEYLWLQAECQGDVKKHEGEFLKKEGDYFEVAKKCPRCGAKITLEEFNKMYPDVKELFYKGSNSLQSTTIETFLKTLNETFEEFEINTCIKKAFFLAQITKETGFFARIDENLYYTTEEALHNYWPKKSHPKLYSNPASFFKEPEKLGNYVYRNVAENGDEASGDGFKYRGRGLIQITRKKGYRRFGEFSGNDLLKNPDLLLSDLKLMTRSAGWYWKHGVLLKNGNEKDLNTVAATGNFKETTRLVHGSTDDVTARETILSNIKSILKTDECQSSEIGEVDIEFHIQKNGEIQYKIINDKRENAEYFYHDASGNVHNLGKYKLKKVKENYGGLYKDKLQKDDENIYLIDIRNVRHSYKKESINFTITVNTNRYFMNDVSIAALLGAMLECGYDDYVFNGFSNEKGESIGGSKSHKNGMNGDLRYLRIDKKGGKTNLLSDNEAEGWKGLDEERQNKFNDALYKFGWKSMLSQNYGKNESKILNHCTNDKDKDHHDHLHIQGFQPTLKEI